MLFKFKISALIFLIAVAIAGIFYKSYLISNSQYKYARNIQENIDVEYSLSFYQRSIEFDSNGAESDGLKNLIKIYKKNAGKAPQTAIKALFAAKFAILSRSNPDKSELLVLKYIDTELEKFGITSKCPEKSVTKHYFPLLSVILFFTWISFVILFIFKSFDNKLKLKLKPAKIWGNLSFILFFIWILSIKFA